MAAIRAGSKVCLIMQMNVKGIVLSITERPHNTSMVDGPLSKVAWAQVQVTSAPRGTDPVIECRVRDLMIDE